MGYSLFVSDKFKDRPEDILAKVSKFVCLFVYAYM